ncbi:alpha/beta fold hydrolase [Phytomonospora endophytica]|uniref:Pimeloyl-ACP methyl ester carboxylesterase n=1 Tax=Phytomonospora endophytica TaxID=714109 RepID=A0A841FMH5_9ACTN|nr:alpha/beta hydrolase [Phytomonospora endophytica]MBB6038501.1 pimeloyl-ACP methyl ester carboxylesterase [Phytomonospora endophytica]GIG64431.1 hypothetical protein Pen01_07260 [Phytomonospora endophytica]
MEMLSAPDNGRPTVVFLPGAGTIGRDYWNLHRRAAELTTSVIYDRAGTGDGTPAELPRTLTEVTDELRSVLRNVDGPYVLVGHSLGGYYARFYATRFPDDVAALLLLDPAHEDYNASMPAELQELWGNFDAGDAAAFLDDLPEEVIRLYRGLFARELADWPAEISEPLVDYHVGRRGLTIGVQEASNLDAIYAEMRAADPLPDVPVLILSSTQVDEFKTVVAGGVSGELLQAEIDAKFRLYNDVAAALPRGEARAVEGGHVTIAWRGEQAIVDAIAELTGA